MRRALLVLVLAACEPGVQTGMTRQFVTCDSCPPLEEVTIVHTVGAVGAPTAEQLTEVSGSIPASTEDPTASSMLLAAEAVLQSLPQDLIDDAIDEFARVGGSRVGCAFDRAWTCWVVLGNRTYYCSVGSVTGCGSFVGTW